MADADHHASHYFTNEPDSAAVHREVRLRLDGRTVDLHTSAGTFSPTRVDPGTQLLVTSLPPPAQWPEGPVLDLGCGYGPLAVAVALADPTRRIWAVDVNARARDDCRRNAERLGLTVEVAEPAEVPPEVRFGLLVSNPPIRIGKAALQQLLGQWLDRLAPGGEAWLVVSRHLGADSLGAWLSDRGHDVERIRSRRGYRVLRVR